MTFKNHRERGDPCLREVRDLRRLVVTKLQANLTARLTVMRATTLAAALATAVAASAGRTQAAPLFETPAQNAEARNPGGARVRPRPSLPRTVLPRTALPPLTWRDLAQPAPLSAAEEALAGTAKLASRFNPAMALPTRDIWPVEVRYAWHDGSDLKACVVGDSGRTLREYVALPKERLAAHEWADLPDKDKDGNCINYSVDAPGDDRAVQGVTGWRNRWRSIMNGNPASHEPPRAMDYPPTQYAHIFWFNKSRGLLAIQYWFYYPYNEWINHHEGDWERINVIVRGPSHVTDKAVFRPVGYQFFFHWWTYEPTKVVRIRDADAQGDHVVVYAGGFSQFLLWNGWNSGGSYPLPAVFPAVGGGLGKWRPPEDTSKPARFIRPEDFKVVLLPEPDRLDVHANPELAWLRLSFHAGQPRMYGNPLKLNRAVFGEAPQQPARQMGWNARDNPPYWTQKPQFHAGLLKLPPDWHAAMNAPPRAYELPARQGRPHPEN